MVIGVLEGCSSSRNCMHEAGRLALSPIVSQLTIMHSFIKPVFVNNAAALAADNLETVDKSMVIAKFQKPTPYCAL